MIKVFDEMNWNDVFESAWSGAKYAAERLQEEGKGEEFMELIEELYPDGIDSDWIYESLGMAAED